MRRELEEIQEHIKDMEDRVQGIKWAGAVQYAITELEEYFQS